MMSNESKMREIARRITEEHFGPSPFKIGDRVEHPTGRTVEIVGGQYWGTHGLSNFWDWREVRADGTLSRKKECGYGWRPTAPMEKKDVSPNH